MDQMCQYNFKVILFTNTNDDDDDNDDDNNIIIIIIIIIIIMMIMITIIIITIISVRQFFLCLPTGTGTYPMLVLELLKQVNRRSYPFATLELRKNLGQVRRAKTSGIVTGDAPLAIFFSLSLVTVPEVFAKVYLSQFPFSF